MHQAGVQPKQRFSGGRQHGPWGSGGKAKLAIGQGMPNSLQGTPQPGGTFLETQTGGLWVFPGELESASVAFE